MPAVTGLFNIFALLYVYRGVQLTARVARNWQAVRQEPLTRQKKQMAEQAAFFIGVPPAVLFHEFSHALAVWLFGGTVVEFGYRVFWGYVVPAGDFTAAQDWFIALAGTLGSLLFGLTVWLLLRQNRSSSLRYFGLRTFRFQVYFSLIYYPVFTLFLPVGDWRTIYDFAATPLLSGLTAVAHVALLVLFYLGDRSGWFERPAFETAEEQEQFETQRAAAANAFDPGAQLQIVDSLRRADAPKQARHKLNSFLQEQPDSAAGYLQLAVLESQGRSEVPRQALAAAQRALELGLSQPRQVAVAHQIAGRYQLDTGRLDEAERSFTQAVAALSSNRVGGAAADGQRGQALYYRSMVFRRQQRYDLAYQEMQAAIEQARRAGDGAGVARYSAELPVIEKHAGHTLDVSATAAAIAEPKGPVGHNN